MFFRKSKLIRELYAEIQRLREALAEAIGARDSARQGFEGMREVAAKAIEAAKEKHFPPDLLAQTFANKGTCLHCARVWSGSPTVLFSERGREHFCSYECMATYSKKGGAHLPDYIAPEVKNCPECSVSVRSDSWPQECPACHCVFGFEEGGDA